MSDLFDHTNVTHNSQRNAAGTSMVDIDFSNVIGQQKVKSILTRVMQRNCLGNAYLFVGPEGSGKNAMAIEFAKLLNCRRAVKRPCQDCDACRQIGALTHPDFRFVFSAPKDLKEPDHIQHIRKLAENPYASSAYSSTTEILIDKIRELKKVSNLRLYNAKVKVFVISEAERMRHEAANSLLKLLEEPPEDLTLILTTSRIDKLLPTVISRCQVIKFSPLSREEIKGKSISEGVDEKQAEILSRLSMGNYRKAQELTQDDFNAVRDQAWQVLMTATVEDRIMQLDSIGELSKGKSRGEIKELFLSVLNWLRDLQIISTNQNDLSPNAMLFNADQIERLKQLAKSYAGVDLNQVVIDAENYIDLIDKNVYINLIFINYLNDLRSLSKQQKVSAPEPRL
jgi:DNA polymerase-3 subunit delta'